MTILNSPSTSSELSGAIVRDSYPYTGLGSIVQREPVVGGGLLPIWPFPSGPRIT